MFLFPPECERIIVSLLVEDVLHPKIVYTSYNTICYIVLGPRGHDMLSSRNPRVFVSFPVRTKGAQKPSWKTISMNTLPMSDENGWISRKDPATKTKTKTNSTTGKSNVNTNGSRQKAPSKSTRKTLQRCKSRLKKLPGEIVELDLLSSSDEDEMVVVDRKKLAKRKKSPKKITVDESAGESVYDFLE